MPLDQHLSENLAAHYWDDVIDQGGLFGLLGAQAGAIVARHRDAVPFAWMEGMSARYGVRMESRQHVDMLVLAWTVSRLNDQAVAQQIVPALRAAHPNRLSMLSDDALIGLWRGSFEKTMSHARSFVAATPVKPLRARGRTVSIAAMDRMLRERYGEEVIDALISGGMLNLLNSATDLPPEVGGRFSASELAGVAGITQGTDKVYLIAGAMTADQVAGVFLHEVGEHAGFAEMLGDDYGRLSDQFDKLLFQGDYYAREAAKRVPSATPAQHVQSERLAYLVEAVSNDQEPRVGGEDGYRLGEEAISQLRTWLYRSRTFKALEAGGMAREFQLTPKDIAELAREAVNYQARKFGADKQATLNPWLERMDSDVLDRLMLSSVEERAAVLAEMDEKSALGYLYALAALDAPEVAETLSDWGEALHALSLSSDELVSTLAGETLKQQRRIFTRVAAMEQYARAGFAMWQDTADKPENAKLYFLAESAQLQGHYQLTCYSAQRGPLGDTQYRDAAEAVRGMPRTALTVPDAEAPALLQLFATGAAAGAAGAAERAFDNWLGASLAVENDGSPMVLYHGTAADVSVFDSQVIWAANKPALANEYAMYRHDEAGEGATVMPVFMRAERPFDADVLGSSASVGTFFNHLLQQAEAAGRIVDRDAAKQLMQQVKACAAREESGPQYRPEDFWNKPGLLFGRDGAQAIMQAMEVMGYDSIRFTEAGALTWGVLSAGQVKSAIGNKGEYSLTANDIRLREADIIPSTNAAGEVILRSEAAQQAFAEWFDGSKIVDEDGAPLLVFRGEHGESESDLQTRRGSISFGSLEAANTYAASPNDRGDNAAAPRVIPAYLRVTKPLDLGDDPFVDLSVLVDAVGIDRAIELAGEMQEWIFETGAWQDGAGADFADVREAIEARPELVNELYLLAYPVLDNPKYVGWLKEAGYDGAILGGSGETALQREYRVFDAAQVRSSLSPMDVMSASSEAFSTEAAGALIEQARAFDTWFTGSQVVDPAGAPLVLYHGTASTFTAFDASLIRTKLNEDYQGDAFFFAESPEVAGKYAFAARNALLNKERAIAAAYISLPNEIAQHFQNLIEQGFAKAWDMPRDYVEGLLALAVREGVDINELQDVAQYVEGSLYADQATGEPLAVFATTVEELPDWVVDSALKLGLGDAIPAPNIIPVYVSATNVLHTSDREAARAARENGYDAVRYTGPGIVDGEAEWMVFDAEKIASAIGERRELVQFVAEHHRDMTRKTPQTETPAFQRWFAESQVVDADGKPLVVYHGTLSDFTEFKLGKGEAQSDGFFFTNKANVNSYLLGYLEQQKYQETERDGEYTVMPAYLSISKPKRLDTTETGNWADPDFENEAIAKAKAEGYDGLIITDDEMDTVFYVAFRPEQIKSAIGNSGDFDPKNPDIRFSRAVAPAPSRATGIIPVDDLSRHEKEDLVTALAEGRSQRFAEATAGSPLSDDEIRQNLFGLADPLTAQRLTLPIEEVVSTAGTSASAVARYASMGDGAPAILVRKAVEGWSVVEGHHRYRAAIARGDNQVEAIDVTALLDMDWGAYLGGESNPGMPLQSMHDGSGIRHSFAGKAAVSADIKALGRAQEMARKGMSSTTILRETGWFMGVDGRWRFEISDDQAGFRKQVYNADEMIAEIQEHLTFEDDKGLVKALYKAGTPEYVGGWGRTKEDAIANTAKHVHKSRSATDFDIGKVVDWEIYPLAQVLDHPNLFAAYPALEHLSVEFYRDPDSPLRGSYFEDSRRVRLNLARDEKEIFSTLLHEIQHAIQGIEGFARGGMDDASFASNLRSHLRDLTESLQRQSVAWAADHADLLADAEQRAELARNALKYESMERLFGYASRETPSGVFRLIRNEMQWIYGPEYHGNEEARELIRKFYDMPRRGSKRNEHIRGMALDAARLLRSSIPAEHLDMYREDRRTTKSMIAALQRESSKASDKLKPLREIEGRARQAEYLQKKTQLKGPYEIYRALAGEIEARLTQTRQHLTSEERRDRAPNQDMDVSPAEAIVIFGGREVHIPTNRFDSNDERPAVMPKMRSTVGSIRGAIEKAYGSLLVGLEAQGLVQIAQTEDELLEAAARARAAATGYPAEAILQSLRATIKAQSAWHGTPHLGIEQSGFRLDKIGTGEGAQSFGWGIYFAGKKEVAESYRKALSQRLTEAGVIHAVQNITPSEESSIASKMLKAFNQYRYLGSEELRGIGVEPEDFGFTDADDEISVEGMLRCRLGASDYLDVEVDGQAKTLYAFRDGSAVIDDGESLKAIKPPMGQLYQVSLPEDEVLLDWDLPLTEQPLHVQAAIEAMNIPQKAIDALAIHKPRLVVGGTSDGFGGRVGGALASGQALYQLLVDGGYGHMRLAFPVSAGPQAASEYLQSMGVPGLKYLDGSSRKQGDGTRNYVIWDEALLSAGAAAIEPLLSKQGRVEGFYDPVVKRAFLIADNLTPETAPGTLMHEVGIHMAADSRMEPLFDRAHQLVQQRGNDPFLGRVHARMTDAGESSPEEAAAYICTEYENDRASAPRTVTRWMRDFRSAVRGWLFRKGVLVKANSLSVADIAAVARGNAREIARAGRASQLLPRGGRVLRSMLARVGDAFTRRRSPLGFYSALEEGVASSTAQSMTADGWKQYLRGLTNKGQIKAEEVDWLGVAEWLDSQDGRISKEQLLGYVMAGGVQVKETVLGAEFDGQKHAVTADEARQILASGQPDIEITNRWGGRILQDRIQMIQDDTEYYAGPPRGLAKYEDYKLPGGENYREVLLTLPSVRPEPLEYVLPARIQFEQEMITKYGGTTFASIYGKLSGAEVDRRELLGREERNQAKIRVERQYRAANFQSTHWEQPNVLAHLRLTDRQDESGRRILFVEEVQSDWGQEGKKKGFVQPQDDTTGFSAYQTEQYGEPYWRVVNAAGEHYYYVPHASASSAEAAIAHAAEHKAKTENDSRLAKAPFVTKTEGWLTLAAKRVAILAAEGGYDAVAFANGQQSAERYNLATRVGGVYYTTTHGVGRGTLLAMPVGATIHDDVKPAIEHDDVPEEELERYVGKEVARKLMDAQEDADGFRSVVGDDLKVGGEGMKVFYDQVVPAAIKKLLPKIGGEPEQVVIDGVPQFGFSVTEAMRAKVGQGLALFSRAKVKELPVEFDLAVPAEGNQIRDYQVGEARISLNVRAGSSEVEVASLRVAKSKRGQGHARRAMQHLIEQADAQGVALALGASPLDRATSVAGLQAFYASLGFEPTGRTINPAGDIEMRRRAPGVGMTNTAAFRRWFGDSKVVDSNGEPMPVYHGTDKPFTAFNADGGARPTFFTDIRGLAESYAVERSKRGSAEPVTQSVYLSISNPMIVDANGAVWDYIAAGGIENNEKAIADLSKRGVSHITTNRAAEIAAKSGFDGVIIKNVIDGYGYNKGAPKSTVYAAFKPEQIKSAIGNNGNFDPSNPDIRFSRSSPSDTASNTAFSRWFGGSKVVVDDGQPQVVFHGTTSSFTKFRISPDGFYGEGVYFSASEDTARIFGEERDEDGDVQVMDAYLALQNPFVFNAPQATEEPTNVSLARALLSDGEMAELLRRMNGSGWYNPTSEFRAKLDAMGHDGLIVNIEGEPAEYIVFRPEQIKSASANVGAYGQRPVTAEEAGPLGLSAAQANREQAKGDVRFSTQGNAANRAVLAANITFEFVRDEDDEGDILLAYNQDERDAQGGPLQVAHLHVPDQAVTRSGWSIGDIYVDPELRRTGMATKMVEAMSERLGGWPQGAVSVFSKEGAAFFSSILARRPRTPTTETQAFRSWFGASKIVNDDGSPKVMYHGTYSGGFAVFDRLKSTQFRRPSMDTVGIWFSDEPGAAGAGMYVPSEGGAIYPVYLRAENTKWYDTFDDFLREMHAAEGRDFAQQSAKGLGSAEGLRAQLKAQGYDSIGFTRTFNGDLAREIESYHDAVRRAKDEEWSVPKAEREPYTAKRIRLEETLNRLRKEQAYTGISTEMDGQNVVVVFEPEQIKSAIGNVGAFNPQDPDIRASFTGHLGGTERQSWTVDFKDQHAAIVKGDMQAIEDRNPEFARLSLRKALAFARIESEYGEVIEGRRRLDWDFVPETEKAEYFALVDQIQAFEEFWEHARLGERLRQIEKGMPLPADEDQHLLSGGRPVIQAYAALGITEMKPEITPSPERAGAALVALKGSNHAAGMVASGAGAGGWHLVDAQDDDEVPGAVCSMSAVEARKSLELIRREQVARERLRIRDLVDRADCLSQELSTRQIFRDAVAQSLEQAEQILQEALAREAVREGEILGWECPAPAQLVHLAELSAPGLASLGAPTVAQVYAELRHELQGHEACQAMMLAAGVKGVSDGSHTVIWDKHHAMAVAQELRLRELAAEQVHLLDRESRPVEAARAVLGMR